MNKIIERIERKAGVAGLVSILSERLSPTDLQSLLLEVYRMRASSIQPAKVLESYATDRFVRPAAVSPVALLRWDKIAFACLPEGFMPVALSPVCPLATNSAVAPVDQNWAVATARNTEVVSDATNVLALEAALRRRALLRADPKSATPVHLAASHRLLRAQYYDRPDLVAHFSLFALCSAGRDRGSLGFELAALRQHLGFYLRALRTYLGAEVPLRAAITDLTGDSLTDIVETAVWAPIRSAYEGIVCDFDPERTAGRGYYQDLCFHVYATTPSGQHLELADGGVVNWTQALLSNAKERLVTSGIGSERLCSVFG